MNNEVIICILEDGFVVDTFKTISDQLEDKHTSQQIVDGIYEYFAFNYRAKHGAPPTHADFDNIQDNTFIIYERYKDLIIILKSSKYYKWFDAFDESDSYTSSKILNTVASIILEDPNKELVAYMNGKRTQ